MDYFVLRGIVSMLQNLVSGKRILNCRQISDQTLGMVLEGAGEKRSDSMLVVETSGLTPGIFLRQGERSGSQKPTQLARSFNNKIRGSRILDIGMPVPDRIIRIRLTSPEWPAVRELWVELIGNRGNVVCVDKATGLIIECLTKYPDPSGFFPARMPGIAWHEIHENTTPKRNLRTARFQDIQATSPVRKAWRTILHTYQPMTPTLAKVIADFAENHAKTAFEQLKLSLFNKLEKEQFDSVIIFPNGKAEIHAIDFGFPGGKRQTFPSLLVAASEWKRLVSQTSGIDQLRLQISAKLNRRIAKLEKTLDIVKAELTEIEKDLYSVHFADLLAANFHLLKKGMDFIEVPDIYSPDKRCIRIPLDPAQSPKAQLEFYYKRKRKIERSGPKIRERIALLHDQLSELERIKTEVLRVSDYNKLKMLMEQLVETGRIRFPGSRSAGNDKPEAEKPYLEYHVDSWDIWVGKNAGKNDIMTFRRASPGDTWLHVMGQRGAHVIIRNPKRRKTIPDRIVDIAARLAVYHSKARGEKAVSVIVTERKNIKKIPGAPAGMVSVNRHRTVMVDSPTKTNLPRERKTTGTR